MTIMPSRRTMLAQLLCLPAGLPCVHYHCSHCDHARAVPRTALTAGEDVSGNPSSGLSNGDFGLRVRPAQLKSP
jgi:hypothetical protein